MCACVRACVVPYWQLYILCFSQGSEESQSSLLPKKQPSSFSTSLLVVGCLLLLLCGFWLLSTIVWLHGPSGQQPHRHPPPAHNASRREACASIPQDWRFDCYPERGVVVTRELCQARNCCFIPASSNSSSAGRGVPWCFYPSDFPSYSLVWLNDTALGQRGKLVREVKTYYPADILTLDIELRYETETRLRVRVSSRFCCGHSWVWKASVIFFFFFLCVQLNRVMQPSY